MMNNLDDLSLMSGISNLSRISKTGSPFYSKFDYSFNSESSLLFDTKSYISNGQKNDYKKNLDSNKVLRALNSCEESTCHYAKLKLIYECLEQLADDLNCGLEKNIVLKLKKLLTINEVKKFKNLPNSSKISDEELSLLGIIDFPTCEFKYEECLDIRSCLENKLRERMHSFISLYENTIGSTKTLVRNNESILRSKFQQKDKPEVLHWKDKIDEVCLDHKKNLNHFILLITRWNELKSEIQKKVLTDGEKLLLRVEVAEMKAVISQLSCSIRLFKETPVTVEAYKILNENLEEKISSTVDMIRKKEQLKKDYDALRGTEFDGILKKYLELHETIEKKKNMLEKL